MKKKTNTSIRLFVKVKLFICFNAKMVTINTCNKTLLSTPSKKNFIVDSLKRKTLTFLKADNKVFLVMILNIFYLKYIKIIYIFYFLKFIFYISISK